MIKRTLIILFLLFAVNHILAQECSSCHDQADLLKLQKSSGIFQKAVGVMDKGQVKNNTGNFGTLSSFHVFFTPSVQWPASAADTRQYCFGLGFMVGINENNVIETETQSTSKILDWLPPDDARGMEFSGDLVAVSDDTPFMASSDLLKTWPDLGWPGYFRVDVNSLSDQQLLDHPDALTLPDSPGEFVSDRDLFCTYNDAENPQGSHGLTVEQTSHSYGRPYAEDILFWDLKLFNDSTEDLGSIYIGLYAKFRPDFDNHDYINFIDSDNDGTKDLVYVYDLNNTPDGAWTETNDPMGIVGLRVFDTPGQIGITDFHHFSRDASPKTDPEMWALMSSRKDTSHLLSVPYYFHGNDPHIDYTGEDSLTSYYPEFSETGHETDKQPGNGINYVISCGPINLHAGASTALSFGLIMGDAGTVTDKPDTSALMENVRTAHDMYKLYFQGSGPPAAPTVHAIAGDKKVTLFWDDLAETSKDILKKELDFEGYRVFRSSDRGLTWGRPVTDVYGKQVGYNPIVQFDYTEDEDKERFGIDISGPDPAFPQSLGRNTGLAHTFVDSNLVNGVEYWYTVSAYDKGDQSNLENPEPSLMNALGQSENEQHTVAVTPGTAANNLHYKQGGILEVIGGKCDGSVILELEDPDALLDHEYELSFDYLPYEDESGDTVSGIAPVLVDLTLGDTVMARLPLSEQLDANTFSHDGFLLNLVNTAGTVKSIGWTKVAGDTCTFDWRIESKYPEYVPTGQAYGSIVETYDDWKITVDYNVGAEAAWLDAFSGTMNDQTQHLPLRVEVITDPENVINVTEHLTLAEFNLAFTGELRSSYYSPLGWDLVPGGLGYLSGSPGWRELHVDMLVLEKIDPDSVPNYLYLFTNNKPDTSINRDNETEIITAVAPAQDDEFTIITAKPFRPGISYRFNPLKKSESLSNDSENSLEGMFVVPDPYIVSNAWEVNEFGKRLMFSNLPSICTIDIYTLLGEHVDTVEHGVDSESSEGFVFWDMRTRNDQFIAPGVYLYHAETPDGHEAVGRFLVIK